LLEQLDKTNTTAKYLAKELPTGRRVALVFTPPALTPDGQLYYHVEERPSQSSSGGA
jgi:hypothetical protein